MRRVDLLEHLRRQNCLLDREDGRHSILVNRSSGRKAPVAWHSEIDERLARKICEQLEIPAIP